MRSSNDTGRSGDPFVDDIRASYHDLDVSPAPLASIRRIVARRRRRRAGLSGCAFLAAAAVTAIVVAQPWSGTQQPSAPLVAPLVVKDTAVVSEQWPSSTLKDWARWADGVVVVQVAAEHPAGEFPAADGTGEVVIGRNVDLTIVDVLWTRSGATAPAGVVEVSAAGWVDRPGRPRAPVAFDGVPRLEIGGTYVVALRSRSDCQPDVDAGWSVLGSSAAWPVEGSVNGTGESGGLRVTVDRAQADVGSLEESMIGRSLDDLRDTLREAPRADRGGAAGC